MRFLIVFCMVVCVMAADAATRCVQLDANVSGIGGVNAEYQSDWTVTEANGVKLSGIGVCSSTMGTNQFELTNNLTFSAENHYCWCRMVAPAVSKWVFYLYYVNAPECAQRCNFRCGEQARINATFRSTLFNNIVQ